MLTATARYARLPASSMPRRAAPLPSVDSAAQGSAAVPYTPSLSPIVKALRTDWRWASISQFINMFSDAFGLLGFDIGVSQVEIYDLADRADFGG